MDEAFKLRVVREVLAGAPHKECAHRHGVSVRAVAKWLALYRQGGRQALGPGRRGRPARSGLTDGQHQRLGDLLAFYAPHDVGLEGKEWSGSLVAALVHRETGHQVSPALAIRWLMPVERGAVQCALTQGLAGLRLRRHHELLGLLLDGLCRHRPGQGCLRGSGWCCKLIPWR
jgi:transposase